MTMQHGDLARALPIARDGLASEDPVERQLALGIVWWGREKAAEAAPWLEPLLERRPGRRQRVMAAAALRRMGQETARSRDDPGRRPARTTTTRCTVCRRVSSGRSTASSRPESRCGMRCQTLLATLRRPRGPTREARAPAAPERGRGGAGRGGWLAVMNGV